MRTFMGVGLHRVCARAAHHARVQVRQHTHAQATPRSHGMRKDAVARHEDRKVRALEQHPVLQECLAVQAGCWSRACHAGGANGASARW